MKKYYQLAKPGIIYGNLITAIAGYLFGTQFLINWTALGATVVGVVGVIGSGCIINNIIDRDLDKKMKRTKYRATVTGEASIKIAVAYAAVLAVIGFLSLALWTNIVTVIVGIVGYIAT